MDPAEEFKEFYSRHVPDAKVEGNLLKAPCPMCARMGKEAPGVMMAYVDPEGFFAGYFRCLNRCRPGGFPLHFGRLMGIDPQEVPGYDPDREPYVHEVVYPPRNINGEVKRFMSLMTEPQHAHFREFGVSRAVTEELKIGYNGRYLVYPYFLEDGNCYAARCVMPEKEEDSFWQGDETFFSEEFQVFNVQEIERCENGALFITEGEDSLLILKELGYPAIAVPTSAQLEALKAERLSWVNHVFLLMKHSPDAELAVRAIATGLGYKARIVKWPSQLKRGYNLLSLARDKGKDLRTSVSTMIRNSKSFSPFSSVETEHRHFVHSLEREKGRELLGLPSGFKKLDLALNGIRGITIMGGQPKAGKSCFFMQVSTEAARRKTPVIYYDFENGRHKIYARTLCRLSKVPEKQMRAKEMEKGSAERLRAAEEELKGLLHYFRVVNDRKLGPDIMRRHIDFLQHETRRDRVLVVVDSLHKLPFKNLSERRTGIDEWLRHMEAIRDEQNAAFLVISELSRGEGGHYDEMPDLGSFKESGDIEYSADNAMILVPNRGTLEQRGMQERKSTLWLVASRENSPGSVAVYALEYPYWGFREE